MELWVPIDKSSTAVDQPFTVETYKDLFDCLGKFRIHREALARPVCRGTQPPQLLRNRATRLRFPVPDFINECVATEVMACNAFRLQLTFYEHLCRNSRVISPYLPEGAATFHSVEANQGIHDGLLKAMAHVQRASHIGRRNGDAERLVCVTGCEVIIRLPLFVPSRLDV